jgi:hypothetical protein
MLYEIIIGIVGICISTGYGLGFDSLQRQEIFLYSTASRSAINFTQSPIQWVHDALSKRIKQTWREAYHSPPSNAEVKNGGAVPHPPYVFMA